LTLCSSPFFNLHIAILITSRYNYSINRTALPRRRLFQALATT
jgi:hypothetical protein